MELTAVEGRVLGCLIEQEAAAPDAVPLGLNTVRLACNQTSGRDPVVAYDDRTVEDTLLSLKSRGLARFVPPSPEARTTRYRHRADERWRMGSAELAVLAVLLLGGVQTVSEVRARAQRLHPLITPVEVEAVLDTLAARTPRPFAARVAGASAGETRWAEVLTGPAPDGTDADDRRSSRAPGARATWCRPTWRTAATRRSWPASRISSSGSRTRSRPGLPPQATGPRRRTRLRHPRPSRSRRRPASSGSAGAQASGATRPGRRSARSCPPSHPTSTSTTSGSA